MSDKLFRTLVIAIAAAGVLITAALIVYTAYLYANCSIISFIANGR